MIKSFLGHVWPSKGIYCLAIPQAKPDGEGHFYKHKTCTTIDEAVKSIEVMSNAKANVYFAVGTLKQEKIWNPNKKNKDGTVGKFEIRSHDNIAFHKALIFDIDAGLKKSYATQVEALNSLKAFTSETGLPKPTIVSSGNGLHIYFTLTEDIEASHWYELATQLKAIAKHFNLKIDNSRTSDKSSVLRVAGTKNWKDKENPKEVKVLTWGEPTPVEQIQNTLKKVIEFNGIAFTKLKEKSELDKLFEGVESNVDSRPKANADLIFSKCVQMARVLEIGGPVGYPIRASATSILKFCEKPDYSITTANDINPAKAQVQLDQMLLDSITDNPHTCERFESEYAEACQNCEFRGKIKSPIVLGYVRNVEALPPPERPKVNAEIKSVMQNTPNESVMQALQEDMEEHNDYSSTSDEDERAAVTIHDDKLPRTLETPSGIHVPLPDPPFPYKRTPRGLYASVSGDEGEDARLEFIYQYDVYPYEIVEDSSGTVFRVVAKLPHGNEKRVNVPMSALVDSKAFNKLFADVSVVPATSDQRNMFLGYMSSYINEIQRICKSTNNYPQLGWMKDEEEFVLPDHVIKKDGTQEECGVSKAIKNAVGSFRKRGTLDVWKQVIDVYARPGYEPYAFGHLVGYGSLLFRFSGFDGAMVNMVGDSGSGKSTVLQTINSIFGHPKEPMLMQHDKYLAKMNRLGIFNSICVTYDEVTNIDPEELSDLCYSITQGRGRNRLDQNANEKENNTKWQLLVASTSNANLMSKLSSLKYDASAESLRVFEYQINTTTHSMNKEEARKTFRVLEENYGHAGEIFINYVIQHQSEVRNLIDVITTKFDREADVPTNERYWSAIVACTLAGGEIAKRLNLCKFDIPRLFQWAVNQVLLMRGVVKENRRDPRGLLVEFLNSHINNTIVIGGGTDKDRVQYVREEPRAGLMIRNEIDRGFAYVSKPNIRAWLSKGGSDYNWVKKTLMESKIIVDEDVNKVLSSGSAIMKTGQSKCWLVNLNHPEMAGNVLVPVAVKKDDKVEELFKGVN